MDHCKSLFICSLSSICSSFVTHPIDVVKVRLQTGTFNNKHLFSGIRASILRNGSFVTSKMFTYNCLKDTINPTQFHERVFCGMVAGGVGSLIGTPFDQIMVKIQNNPSKFTSVPMTIKYILDKEGLFGMWNSVYYTSSRAIIVTACQFGIYEQMKNELKESKTFENEVGRFFIASSVSSFFTSVLSNPIDVCKNRVICDMKNVSIRNIVREEGVLALWKGWHLNIGRQIPLNMTRFGFLELITTFLK